MNECESVGVAIFEILLRFVEHDAVHAAVAVDQGEFGLGLLL